MLKTLENFLNGYLDFEFIVVNNEDYFPLNSNGGNVLFALDIAQTEKTVTLVFAYLERRFL